MVGFVVCAVKRYQTSSNTVPAQLGVFIVAVELLAGPRFPSIPVQVIAEFNVTAPAQSSFGGAGLLIQILYPHDAFVPLVAVVALV
jgi:hypothetical protein